MDDNESLIQDEKTKAYYLYSNNQFKELLYKDLEALLPHASLRVKDKINLGLHYMS
jgi:hypothetical protein